MKNKPTLIRDILTISTTYGWDFLHHDDNCKMLSVSKEKMRINIFYTKMTVVVCIPKQQQVALKKVSIGELEKIFIETGK